METCKGKNQRSVLVLHTGRVIYTVYGVIGVNVQADDVRIFTGFDDELSDMVIYPSREAADPDWDAPLTTAERVELAEFMITRWQQVKTATEG